MLAIMDDQQHEALETQLGDGDIEPKLEDHQGPLTQDEPLLNLDFTESTLKTSRAELECPSITSSATHVRSASTKLRLYLLGIDSAAGLTAVGSSRYQPACYT